MRRFLLVLACCTPLMIAAFRGGALWLGGAVVARKVHTLEVAGSNPALATSRKHSGRTHFFSIDSAKASVSRGFCAENIYIGTYLMSSRFFNAA